jgi:hypothetical protein
MKDADGNEIKVGSLVKLAGSGSKMEATVIFRNVKNGLVGISYWFKGRDRRAKIPAGELKVTQARWW